MPATNQQFLRNVVDSVLGATQPESYAEALECAATDVFREITGGYDHFKDLRTVEAIGDDLAWRGLVFRGPTGTRIDVTDFEVRPLTAGFQYIQSRV